MEKEERGITPDGGGIGEGGNWEGKWIGIDWIDRSSENKQWTCYERETDRNREREAGGQTETERARR